MKNSAGNTGVARPGRHPNGVSASTASQGALAPGSSAQGARLLQEKTCLNCHAFNGRGGTGALDLAQRRQYLHTHRPTSASVSGITVLRCGACCM